MESNADLFAVLNRLVDRWCERKALAPLSIVLRAYPMVSPLSDSWFELRTALRSLRRLREPAVTEAEANDVEEALRFVGKALAR